MITQKKIGTGFSEEGMLLTLGLVFGSPEPGSAEPEDIQQDDQTIMGPMVMHQIHQ